MYDRIQGIIRTCRTVKTIILQCLDKYLTSYSCIISGDCICSDVDDAFYCDHGYLDDALCDCGRLNDRRPCLTVDD